MNNRVNATRFLGQEELAKQLLELDLNETTYPMGGIPLLTIGNKVYVDATDSHSIIFGATGSKKTRMFAMPSIGIFARAGESFVVTDPKGELYERTSDEAKQQGYHVYCLNLRDLTAGEAWNPLLLPYRLYHSKERAKAMEMVNELAVLMTGEDSNQDKFWTYTTVDVLAGLLFFMFETRTAGQCTLENLNKVWNYYTSGRKHFIEEVKKKFGGTMIYTKLSALDNSSDKTVGSIEAIVSMAMNRIMVNEEMVSYLSRNSIDLGKIAEQKSAVYLIIPDENKTYHFIVSLFLEQLYEVLIKKAQESEQNMLPTRMNFLIDEFANIPKLESMDSMITASRSRNIRFHLIIQSLKQLRHKYEEYADVICSNCNNWVYLYSKEYELLQEISRLCGEVIYDNGIRVPLISEFDLQHLNKEKGEALILAGRNYPCIANLKDIDEYPFAKGKREEVRHTPLAEEENSNHSELPWEPEHSHLKTEENPQLFKKPEKSYDTVTIQRPESGKKTSMRRGLLAVGPENIILSSAIYMKDHLVTTMERLENEILKVHGILGDYVEWYSVEEKGIEAYREAIMVREKEFFMLTDFPEFEFVIEKPAKYPFKKKGKFEMTLWEEADGEKRIIFQDEVVDYGNILGEYFARKQFFAKTGKVLEQSPYAEKRWSRKRSETDGEWIFKKEISGVGEITGVLRRLMKL